MIEWQDDKDVFGRMFALTGDPIFKNLRNAVDNHDVDLSDALSWGQLKSKRWLIEKLQHANQMIRNASGNQQSMQLGTVFLCGGWYATIVDMLFKSGISIEKVRSFDIDPSCAPIAECVNKPYVIDEWKFKAATLDIHTIRWDRFDYVTHKSDGTELKLLDSANSVINTSCEHIFDFTDWYDRIPRGMLVVMQSNDFFEAPDHVNCYETLEEFAEDTPLRKELFSGTLSLSRYNRFMRIGFKE
jgi:hypothetical protein